MSAGVEKNAKIDFSTANSSEKESTKVDMELSTTISPEKQTEKAINFGSSKNYPGLFSTPTSSVSPSKAVTRSRDKLPNDFHQKVIEMENKFTMVKNLETMQELLHLYKLGVEYYSGRSVEKQEDYLNRMQIFLSNKTVLKLMKVGPNTQNVKSNKHRSKTSLESKLMKNKLMPYQKRSSVLFSLEINKLNHRNSIRNNGMENSLSFLNNTHNNAQPQFNAKEFIRTFELGVAKACIKTEESVKEQRTQFLENLKVKLFQQSLKSDSKINTRNQSFIKRKNIGTDSISFFNTHSPPTSCKNLRASLEDMSVPVKKLDFNCEESAKLQEAKPKSKKQKNKKHIGTLVDGYMTKLHQTYYAKYCEQALKQSIDIISQGFNKKIERFNEYNDQRMDLELMLLDTQSKKNILYNV